MRFGKNVLCPKYIDIYELSIRMYHVRPILGCTWSTVHFWFIIQKKMKKVQEQDQYLNQILHHFDF